MLLFGAMLLNLFEGEKEEVVIQNLSVIFVTLSTKGHILELEPICCYLLAMELECVQL